MFFDGFKVIAIPKIAEASCKECHGELQQVSNGWLSNALYCPKCEAVYRLELVQCQRDKVDEEFLVQCREEVAKRGK